MVDLIFTGWWNALGVLLLIGTLGSVAWSFQAIQEGVDERPADQDQVQVWHKAS